MGKTFFSEPGFVFSTHVKRNAYLIPVPIYGISAPPFLHSTIEFQDRGIAWAFPALAEKMRILMRLWNGISGLTAWVGIWLLLLCCVAFYNKDRNIITTIIFSFSFIGLLFIFAPIPDARYVLGILLASQIYLTAYFFSIFTNHK